jgi:hypothetical protein
MYLKTSLLCSLLLACSLSVNAQVLVNTFTDPCSKKVTVFVVPLQGTTIIFMGKSKYITAQDVQSGALMAWVNQVYAEYAAPCPVAQLTQQLTTNTVSNAVSSAVGSVASSVSVPAPSAAPASAPAPAQSQGSSNETSTQSEGSSSETSSDSKSESSDDSKSDSKKEEKKESKKEEKKKSSAKAGQTPLIFSSDLSAVNQINGSFNLMANLGVSRASMAGDVSYGSTLTIFSNLRQFALSTRYSKMDIQNGKLCGVASGSYTMAYSDGNIIHIGGYSYVMSHKSYIYGYALSLINTTIPFEATKQQFWASSVVMFGMYPITYSKRLNLTPELFIMSSPLTYSSKSKDLTANSQMTYIIGSSFDIAISKRFRLSTNVKYMYPIHTIGLLVGTKFNL